MHPVRIGAVAVGQAVDERLDEIQIVGLLAGRGFTR